MKLLYRADGGYPIGSGHIFRAVRILNELNKLCDLQATLMMAEEPNMMSLAAMAPASLHLLPPRANNDAIKPLLDATPILSILQRKRYDVCLIDMLDTPEADMRALSQTGVTLVAFDDRGPGRTYADAIFNVLVEEPDRNALKLGCKLHEGDAFAMLDTKFSSLDEAFSLRTYESSGKILVTMGGVDAAGLTIKAAKALMRVDGIEKVIFVGGSAYPHRNDLQHELISAPWEWELKLNLPGLIDLYLWCDLALIAGGLTMYEACCTGVPALAICQPIDHQLELAQKFSLAGAMETVGYGLEASEDEIAERVRILLNSAEKRMSLGGNGRRLVDGQGVRRTALAILDLLSDLG